MKWYVAHNGSDSWKCGKSFNPCRTLGAKWSKTFGGNASTERVDRVQVMVQTNLTLRDTELFHSNDHVVYLEFLHHQGAVQLHLVNLTFYRVIFEVKTADISFILEGCHFDSSGIHVYSSTKRLIHDVTIDSCDFRGKLDDDKPALKLEETRGVSLVRSLLHDIEAQAAIYCEESELPIEDTTLENVTYTTAIIQLHKNCKMTLRRITVTDARYRPVTMDLRPDGDINAAIKLQNSNVTIASSNFTGNDVPIKADRSTVFITGSEFSGNNAVEGGALEVFTNSHATVHDCVFRNNSAKEDGGAIMVTFDSTLNASGCTFEDNACDSDGGALAAHRRAVVHLTDCLFDGNRAKRHHGGAVFLDRRSNMTSHNTSYIWNVAAVGGGAIMMLDHSRYNATGGHFNDNVASDTGTAPRGNSTYFCFFEEIRKFCLYFIMVVYERIYFET